MNKTKASGYLLALFGMLLLSFTLIGLKLGLESFSPIVMSFGRVIPASILAFAVLKISGAKLLPPREDLGRVLGLTIGVVIAFPVITSFTVQHIHVGEAGVLQALSSLITATLSVFYGHKHPGLRFWLASAVGTVAAMGFAITRSAANPVSGDLLWYALMLLAVFLWAWGQVTGGTLTGKHHSMHILAWAILIGTPINALITITDLVANPVTAWPTLGAWFGFLYVSLVSMFLVFFIWYGAMDRIGVAKTSQFQLAQPVATLIFSIWLLGEVVPPSTWIFAAVIIAAVASSQSAGQKVR